MGLEAICCFNDDPDHYQRRSGNPAGALADARSAYRPLVLGLAFLVAADLCLAFGQGLIGTFLGIALWGGHMALTQGLLAQLVAEKAPAAMRGSAFGMFNLATGLTMLAASVLAVCYGTAWGHRPPSWQAADLQH